MTTTTPTNVYDLPTIRVASNGYEVVAERPYSFHPDDHYLTVVLARSPNARLAVGRELVTWTFNSQVRGYSSGHYFAEAQAAEAVKDFETRGKRGAAYRLLTAARANAADALPIADTWMHRGTEKSAGSLVREALKNLDAAIARAAEL